MDTARTSTQLAPAHGIPEGSVTYDIYFVGVGGQGVLTIGEIIAEAAFRKGIPVNFYPTKGMAQRGGFVKAQLRLGSAAVGPTIPERGADLVVATEVSEALKAVRFVRPDGDFVLYGHVWAPTAVMLGKASYPKLAEVAEAARAVLHDGGRFHHIPPDILPLHEGSAVPDNVFTLAVVLGTTRLGEILPPAEVEELVRTRWKRGVERNMLAFEAGLAFARAELAVAGLRNSPTGACRPRPGCAAARSAPSGQRERWHRSRPDPSAATSGSRRNEGTLGMIMTSRSGRVRQAIAQATSAGS